MKKKGVRKMTVKALKDAMVECVRNNDMESYNELWAAVRVLTNFGLIDDKYRDAMVKEDKKFFENDYKPE